MSYNEDKARAKIKAIIAAVTDIGKVHDYERYANDWETLVTYYLATGIGASNDEMLRGWNISLAEVRQEEETFGTSGDKAITYDYKIRGFYAVSDADASEKTFVTLALAVLAALDADPNLHSGLYESGSSSKFASEYVSRARFDFRLFCGVLVHYVEIDQEVQEVI